MPTVQDTCVYGLCKRERPTYASTHCVEWQVQALVVGILRGIANCVTDKVSERCPSTSNHCDTGILSETECSRDPAWAAKIVKRCWRCITASNKGTERASCL